MVHRIVHAALPRQDELRDRHQLKPLPNQPLDHTWQRRRCVLGRVVEQRDRPRLRLGYHPLSDLRRREVFPVQAVTTGNKGKALGRNGSAAARPPDKGPKVVLLIEKTMIKNACLEGPQKLAWVEKRRSCGYVLMPQFLNHLRRQRYLPTYFAQMCKLGF